MFSDRNEEKAPTVIDETAILFDTIMFSAGRIGAQVEMSLDDLIRITDGTLADITTI